MGFGDDWKKAVEKVKGMHVAARRAAGMIRDMLFEAVDYLRAKDLDHRARRSPASRCTCR